ncbi:hypothetical protein GCM10010507_37730 [Streptomyces cinnamoneus]|uniref:Uncharacterized protein n=1 Tax=Streptomyces cinnamoneus TaxID=53446 RepID=A0A918WLE0_STRCJ|nr:hypothetical protein GCM10010507_37730 [Streptomyces cinnamoneus]
MVEAVLEVLSDVASDAWPLVPLPAPAAERSGDRDRSASQVEDGIRAAMLTRARQQLAVPATARDRGELARTK